MIYVLVGFMGAGKTQLLQRLKAKGEGLYLDLDQVLEQELEGRALGGWILEVGLSHFRYREGKVLERLSQEIKGEGTVVLALGGGTLEHHFSVIQKYFLPETRRLIWLATPFEKCWERISSDPSRPLVRLGREALEELYQERVKTYQKADIHLDMAQQEQIRTIEDLQSWS